jgi:hypothetical protein
MGNNKKQDKNVNWNDIVKNATKIGWQLKINSAETLALVNYYCHDQYFDLDDLVFDKKKKIFSLIVWRVLFEENKCIKDCILFQKLSAPVIKSKLTFRHISELKVQDAEPDDIITDISFSSTKNEISIECGKPTKILLKTKKLQGKLENLSGKVVDAFVYTTYLYWMEKFGAVNIADVQKRIEEKK